ncbi:hypothetical protein ACS15_5713 [Ralstonia insidiosa]|uniref:Uncharacterized protein n=1 Tax=Ralstonia insidiosa TaxID=190721 RepID=A0AAC9FTU9_9RALS|nr:hypothetical protein ACS15_5713 [Ralstonia insidiosa]
MGALHCATHQGSVHAAIRWGKSVGTRRASFDARHAQLA